MSDGITALVVAAAIVAVLMVIVWVASVARRDASVGTPLYSSTSRYATGRAKAAPDWPPSGHDLDRLIS